MKSSKLNAAGTGTHWGELPPRETHKQEIITPDVIENVWRQVLDETKDLGFDIQTDNQAEHFQLSTVNPHVLNTINLHQRLRDLEDGISHGAAITEIEDSEMPADNKNSLNPFRFLFPQTDQTDDEFKGKISAAAPNERITHLKPETAHDLLRHSMIVLLAHTGFETSSDIAIEALTDIAEQFLNRTARLLKLAAEQDECGFPDVVERVLCESGVGGARALHDYYQENILRFESNMKIAVEKAAAERKELDSAGCSKMEQDDAFGGVGFDELDEFGNVCREVPTLQLLDPELGFPPSLDAGFQMLHSLEQEGLNGLEVEEEEVNVSDSPNSSRQRQSEALTEKRKKM